MPVFFDVGFAGNESVDGVDCNGDGIIDESGEVVSLVDGDEGGECCEEAGGGEGMGCVGKGVASDLRHRVFLLGVLVYNTFIRLLFEPCFWVGGILCMEGGDVS